MNTKNLHPELGSGALREALAKIASGNWGYSECVRLAAEAVICGRGAMKRKVIHKQVYRRGPFGGTLNTTLCGRMLLSADGVNSGDAGVTCKFCLRRMSKSGPHSGKGG